ncbi:hypothetical protein AUC43_08775 [Hymenobacter sedentarius]|uniref:Uncharacterized protein n=1 Tax=Hymenobacter sedentarius TaxID=1411621 RepID=A0A0U4CAF2_9BACT|nr:hypothetical protein [Hymenobacter sedentarius]ALW85177.1 hypothetical protein AUC43_08775 [Hymenobacter sedentarius]
MKYYCNDNFDDLPEKAWQLLVDRVIESATHFEVSRTFSKAPFPAAFTAAEVPLPENINRTYAATNRFLLTPEVIAEVKRKTYKDWDNYDSEDPAFYQEDVLLLGTITHEDYVVMRLDEKDRTELNSQGFDFWCEWNFN